MENIKAHLLLALKLIMDAVSIAAAYVLSYYIKFGFSSNPDKFISTYLKYLFFLIIMWLVILNLLGLFKPYGQQTSWLNKLKIIVIAGIISTALNYLVVWFFYKEAIFSLSVILLGSIISAVLLTATSFVIHIFSSKLH
ncbi:MAG: hypothetical protein NTZ10_03135 [Candidatus Saganbacteria bacterium]|nr:hypothetical protein [Candidatus Saganbacteria bacterium]